MVVTFLKERCRPCGDKGIWDMRDWAGARGTQPRHQVGTSGVSRRAFCTLRVAWHKELENAEQLVAEQALAH